MNYTYRIMGESDIAKIVPLYIEQYNTFEDACWTEETVTRRIQQVITRQDSFSLLMEQGDSPVGFAMGYFEQYDDLFAYDLIEIVIAHAHQGKGLGTALMQELERQIKSMGAGLIQLQSVKDARHEHFYGKLGFGTAANLVLKTKPL